MRMTIRTLICLAAAVVLAAAVCWTAAGGEEAFTVKRIGNLISFENNEFDVYAPEDGLLTIRVHDEVSVYRVLSQEVSAGDTRITWDGCGYNHEKLYSKSYTVSAELAGRSGKLYNTSFLTPVEYSGQCLQYALPSSDRLALSDAGDWFLEFRTVMKGTVRIELVTADGSAELFSYTMNTVGGKINRKDFPTIAGTEMPPAGRYRLTVYEVTKPDEKFEYDLEITDDAPAEEEVFVTGEILPERGMSDAEIWEIMTAPSVVVDIDYFSHQQVHEKPDEESPSLGTVHGQTQALKVIRLEDGWAFVGAWNHEEAEYVEGWIPLERLKVVRPQTSYGILIDKKAQTLTLYDHGKKADTILVSTGRAERKKYEQETSAGSFLTGWHRVDFSMNGNKYDYVIQYDGGNLLHQTPYAWGLHKKDFTLGRGYLGTKASHACIRIQAEPGEGGVNAYWLWTHIPYHTRVIILDDPEERREWISKLKRTGDFEKNGGVLRLNTAGAEESNPDDSVILTFAGTMIPGGTPAYNNREDSFVSTALKPGAEPPFRNLSPWFENDDLTCVLLGSLLKEPPKEYLPGTEPNQAPPRIAEVFSASSVEMTALNTDSVCVGGSRAAEETAGFIQPYASALTRETPVTAELKGHLFGFACCSEAEYLKDPGMIDRRIAALREQGCEKIIFLCSWGEGKTHSVIQEAMARRCARAGADLVIGNQAGTVQGMEWVGNTPVIYSTGTLLNGTDARAGKERGLLVRAVFRFGQEDDSPLIRIIPVNPYGALKGEKNLYCPEPLTAADSAEAVLADIWNDSTDAALQRAVFAVSGGNDQ